MTVLVILLILITTPARAACINPPGVAGEVVFNTAHCTMQQC